MAEFNSEQPTRAASDAAPLLLDVRQLEVSFSVRGAPAGARLRAVDGVSLHVGRGEVLGLVGESGCGKSTLARAVLQLAPMLAGSVFVEGRRIQQSDTASLRFLRRRAQMVFQDPIASLNPRMTVQSILAEPLLVHGIRPRDEIPGRVAELLDLVGLSARSLRKFPHEFSGGQRQRIAIARALACEPALLIADEPVSALDVSIQAQIINLLQDLVARLGLGLLFIAHDLSVVKHVSDRVAVMYLGRLVEEGPATAVIEHPLHPYTQALVSAIPVADPVRARQGGPELLQGDPPSPLNPPPGCRFHPRCPLAQEECRSVIPVLQSFAGGRCIACPLVVGRA